MMLQVFFQFIFALKTFLPEDVCTTINRTLIVLSVAICKMIVSHFISEAFLARSAEKYLRVEMLHDKPVNIALLLPGLSAPLALVYAEM